MIEEIQHQSTLEARPAARRIGLIALATDHTVEADFRRLVARDDIAVHVTRVGYANPTTPENLRAMHPRLAAAAALLLPGEDLDAIVYGCTSASVVIGEEAVAAAIGEGKPGASAITPAGSAVLALRTLKARRIAILTPYIRRTAEPMQAYFEAKGFGVDCLACLGMEDDREMARLPRAEIVRLAAGIAGAGTDALFIACTALRAAQCVPEIERQTGLPVVTSNLAAAWASLRQCGVAPDPDAVCRLLTTA
ncbi:ectoine utilization protein EutA [Shinella sp. S4-D37]|uniref:aspartate racemase/maleate isomerase family protein n=1 Tax=Shinella sp. S4-D37 TaxID=3161999 RepID=UPI00346791DD